MVAVAPYWNVNLSYPHSIFFLYIVAVAPYWNVNFLGGVKMLGKVKVAVAPYWNVNKNNVTDFFPYT